MIYFIVLLSILTGFSNNSQGIELQTGFSLLEEGDDRHRPSVHIGLRANNVYEGKIFYTNQTFGPVKTDLVMVSGSKLVSLFSGNDLEASLGGALLLEATQVEYSGEDASHNVSDNQVNLGGFIGIYWSPIKFGQFKIQGGWESGLFLAGINGGLLLATGRKQFLSLGLRGTL